MDLDALHHYFYFYDTDLEEDPSRCVAPSEDIWKKFELVPSPRPTSGRLSGGTGVMAPLGSELGWDLSPPMKGPGPWAGALSSMVLLRDCMWGGFSTRGCLEKVLNERLSTGSPKVQPACKLEPEAPEVVTKIPEPVALPVTPAAPKPDTKAPISSGSDTPSDSEDDDEIDVVSVGKRRARRAGRKPVLITVRTGLLDPGMRHFHISIHQQQHNYAARYPPDPAPQPPPEPVVQVKMEEEDSPSSPDGTMSPMLDSPSSPEALSPKGGSSGSGASSGSDGEVVKKNNHNYMERKRRYDLRSRFLALREQVPGLTTTSKTPKVVILSAATTFLHSLVTRERRLALEKRQLQARQRQLRKLIIRLKAK
ncbi:protein L-Myc [Ambystoma mexicanum]|uniref:protein L-Myc n=1 Tax=Ambystoma mexicanum TaxID=8296 RepID=UPI0037E96A3F